MKHKVKILDLSKKDVDATDISDDSSKVNSIYQETSGYSITPRTFESRTLIKEDLKEKINDYLSKLNEKKAKIENILSKLDIESIMTESCALGISDGILSAAKSDFLKGNLQKLKLSFESKNTAIDDLIHQLEKLESNYKSDIATFFQDQYQYMNKSDVREGPIVHRFGINFSCMENDYIKEIFDDEASTESTNSKQSSKIKLQHPLELFLLEYAIEYLKNNEDKVAVLLDIIVRDQNGKITRDSKNIPEVHTIVLCKTCKQNEYLVIDPNKVSHSQHIATQGYYYDENILIKIPKIPDIYTGKKDYIGPNINQYRDCIDISVKLAFSFQKNGKNIDPDKVDYHQVLKMISNNSVLDKAAQEFFEDTPVRIKQMSNTEFIKEFHELEIILDKDIKRLDEIDSPKAREYKTMYQGILSGNDGYKKMATSLIYLNHEIIGSTVELLEKNKLPSDIFNKFDE